MEEKVHRDDTIKENVLIEDNITMSQSEVHRDDIIMSKEIIEKLCDNYTLQNIPGEHASLIFSALVYYNKTLLCSAPMPIRGQLSRTSARIGQVGERMAFDVLSSEFQDVDIEDTSKVPHKGDFYIDHRFLYEIKNYSRIVPTKEVDKFKADLDLQDIDYGVFVSIDQAISKVHRFQIEEYGKRLILYVPRATPDSIKWSFILIRQIARMKDRKEIKTQEVMLSIKGFLINLAQRLEVWENSMIKIDRSLRDARNIKNMIFRSTLDIMQQYFADL